MTKFERDWKFDTFRRASSFTLILKIEKQGKLLYLQISKPSPELTEVNFWTYEVESYANHGQIYCNAIQSLTHWQPIFFSNCPYEFLNRTFTN